MIYTQYTTKYSSFFLYHVGSAHIFLYAAPSMLFQQAISPRFDTRLLISSAFLSSCSSLDQTILHILSSSHPTPASNASLHQLHVPSIATMSHQALAAVGHVLRGLVVALEVDRRVLDCMSEESGAQSRK